MAVMLAVLAAGTLGAFLVQFRGYEASLSRKEAHYQRALAAKTLLAALQDAENGQRGYLITGSPRYLQPYELALPDMERHLDALEAVLSGDRPMVAKVAEIRTVAARRLSVLAETIAVHDSQGFEAARDMVLSDSGRDAMQRLRYLVGGILEATAVSLAYETERAEADAARLIHIWLGSTGLILALIGSTMVLIVHEKRQIRDLTERLAHEARHDPLTGLLNRRALTERLDAALSQAAGSGVGLLYVDLDGFKAINDDFGHAAGDEALVGVARRLAAAAGPDAAVGRLGGDEFAVLLPALAERSDLAALAGRISRALDSTRVGPRLIGVSLGAAAYPEDGPSAAALIAAADAAMYASKQERCARIIRDAGSNPCRRERAQLA